VVLLAVPSAEPAALGALTPPWPQVARLPLGLCCGMAFLYRTDLASDAWGWRWQGRCCCAGDRTAPARARSAECHSTGLPETVAIGLAVLHGPTEDRQRPAITPLLSRQSLRCTQGLAGCSSVAVTCCPSDSETAAAFGYYVFGPRWRPGRLRVSGVPPRWTAHGCRDRLFGCVCLGGLASFRRRCTEPASTLSASAAAVFADAGVGHGPVLPEGWLSDRFRQIAGSARSWSPGFSRSEVSRPAKAGTPTGCQSTKRSSGPEVSRTG